MEVVRFATAPLYTLPGHAEVVARRLQGGEASSADFALVGHSYLSGGAAVPMDTGAVGKVYVVTEGVITIEQADGTRHVLKPLDSIYIPPGESRAIVNDSDESASMIVVTPLPK